MTQCSDTRARGARSLAIARSCALAVIVALVACKPPEPPPAAEDARPEPARAVHEEPIDAAAAAPPAKLDSAPSAVLSSDEDLSAIAARMVGRRAFGHYLLGRKIGYEIRDAALVQTERGPFFRKTVETRARTRARGSDSDSMRISSEWYWLANGGALARYESERTHNGERSTVRAAWRDGRFEVTRTTAGEAATSVLESPRPSFGELKRAAEFFSPSTEVGAVVEFWVLDEASMDLSRRIQYTLLSSSARSGDSPGNPFFEIESVSRGLVRRFVRNGAEEGRWITDGPVESRPEPEEVAVQLPAAAPDLTDLSTVRIGTDMGRDASALRETTLLIGGVEGFDFSPCPSQSVERLPNGVARVRIRREPTAGAPEPLDEASRTRYVSSDVGIESNSETIRDRAQKIIGGAKDAATQAVRLLHWVHGHLSNSTNLESASALVILRVGGGDCSENARLFVALARAIGLPAREVFGLLYSNREGPAFAWHAWAEVHDGTRWIGVDPAWDQFGLDAGHVVLRRGAEDDACNRLTGRLRIEVEEFVKRSP